MGNRTHDLMKQGKKVLFAFEEAIGSYITQFSSEFVLCRSFGVFVIITSSSPPVR
jgi:hypothetical protein